MQKINTTCPGLRLILSFATFAAEQRGTSALEHTTAAVEPR